MSQNDIKASMKKHLEEVVKNGTNLYLEGKKVSIDELTQACCVNEEVVYMPDYIVDPEGKLIEIRYDRIQKF